MNIMIHNKFVLTEPKNMLMYRSIMKSSYQYLLSVGSVGSVVGAEKNDINLG